MSRWSELTNLAKADTYMLITDREARWLFVRARNARWALGKILRGERMPRAEVERILEEFDEP